MLFDKQDGRPGLCFAETFSTSPLKPLNGIQRDLTGSKISTPSIKFVFLRADQKKQEVRPGGSVKKGTYGPSAVEIQKEISSEILRFGSKVTESHIECDRTSFQNGF